MIAEALPDLAALVAGSARLRACPSWNLLESHAAAVDRQALRGWLDDPGRYGRFSRQAAGIGMDFSRQLLDARGLELLLQLAEQRDLLAWRQHFFRGSAVNGTEGRPALHTALRSRRTKPLMVDGVDVRALAREELGRMLDLADRVGSGDYRGHTGEPITDVVNIGIGGSDLGLVMATEALAEHQRSSVRCHFVSNIDGLELARVLTFVDPARTLFIICSKSFTTLETQLNAESARAWFLGRLPPAAVARHFVAVSVNDAAMDRFGIAREGRFRIWDWVGGRYSLWSSVGLAVAIAIGPAGFRALLDGAAALDEHFAEAALPDNLPVLLGLIGVWNQNFLGTTSHVVLPYTQRLHRFPAFLQQLEMESNGKRVTRDGQPVAWTTGGPVWGEPGSNGQHAFFQLLHQGTALWSADFIAPARPAGGDAGQHMAALANMLAQAETFARGRTLAEARADLVASGMPEAKAGGIAVHRVHPGGHPSTVLVVDRLEPASLGALIALYEHKVFVQSVIWGINPFDQWGVELGKTIARTFSAALAAGRPDGRLPRLAEDILEAQGLRTRA